MTDVEFAFAPENETCVAYQKAEKWKIMVVDDEADVHKVTKMALADLVFERKAVDIISAYSSKDAKKLIEENQDVAIILLDVVMEEDDSGLKLVKWIREEIQNSIVRIILRTGQPGQAPAGRVIIDYDINDYKEKSELTIQKLFTSVISSLRSYRDLSIIRNNKQGLENIIDSLTTIFEIQSMSKFASSVLTQLISILNLEKNSFHCTSFAATKWEQGIYILSGTGHYAEGNTKKAQEIIPQHVFKDITKAFHEKRNIYNKQYFISYFCTKSGLENVVYMEGVRPTNELDRYMIDIYISNVSIAFENISLNQAIENTQKEVIFTLGEIVETRSQETGYHVQRVAEYSRLLALEYGFSEEEAKFIALATPMHDVGKIAIPDKVLNKPGALDADEFELIKSHTKIGSDMLYKTDSANDKEIETIKNHTKIGGKLLGHSKLKIMKAAATIAIQHHEKYNGQGYPNGLRGKEIDIYGRIVAIADVFDALSSDRVYHKAWSISDIVDYFEKERGGHFDPKLVNVFLAKLDKFLEIKERYSDNNV